MIALILETIDKCSQWKSMRHLAHLIGEDSAARWNDMINYLYLLLGQYIQYHPCAAHISANDIRYSNKTSNCTVYHVIYCIYMYM